MAECICPRRRCAGSSFDYSSFCDERKGAQIPEGYIRFRTFVTIYGEGGKKTIAVESLEPCVHGAGEKVAA